MKWQIRATALALSVVAVPVSAAWIEYGDNGKATFYYDDQSIQVTGNFATVVEMLNYGFPLRGVLSNRSTKEFNCTTHSFRYLSLSQRYWKEFPSTPCASRI